MYRAKKEYRGSECLLEMRYCIQIYHALLLKYCNLIQNAIQIFDCLICSSY